MQRPRSLWSLSIARLVAVVGLTAGAFAISGVFAQEPAVSVGSLTLGVAQQGKVTLQAQDIADPGLGAWTIDISYNADVVSVVDCHAEQGGICNPHYHDQNVVRVTGTNVFGLTGDSELASVGFACKHTGSSDLTLSVSVLVDATPGDLQDIDAAVENGAVTCMEQPQPTPTPTTPPHDEKGDVNCDDETTAVDAALVLQFDAGLIHALACKQNGDLNHDGAMNAIDAAIILQKSAGIV